MDVTTKCPECGTEQTHKDRGGRRRHTCSICSYEYRYKNQLKKPEPEPALNFPEIEGITANESVDFESTILPYLKRIGNHAKDKIELEKRQTITMPENTGPFAIALLSDVHGGAKADYAQIETDLNIIENTPGMFAGTAGDMTDNFIIGTLTRIQKEQKTTFDMEQRFLEWMFKKLDKKLLFAVSGNHDLWTDKLSAVDPTKNLLKHCKCLYNNHQIIFKLKWNGHERAILCRHKYKYSSIYNPTHGLEVSWERNNWDFDIAIGGHTHIATLCRPFIKHDIRRYAVLLGTYKLRDGFGRECGFADTASDSRGCGAFVFHPDGRMHWCNDLQTAKDFLQFWQTQAA